jgi:hypothetical protein
VTHTRLSRDPLKRLWRSVDRSQGDDACWPRTTCIAWNGYSKMMIDRKVFYAHRAVWELTRGPIPDGLFVLHRCDNPPCINPSHLFLGTQLDNARDRQAKGRNGVKKGDRAWWPNRPLRGSKNGRAKLTEAAVLDIRRAYRMGTVTQRELALRHGVDPSLISEILAGKRWAHVREDLP